MAVKKSTTGRKTGTGKKAATEKNSYVIKATVIKRNDGYLVVGLEKTATPGVYEKTLLPSFSGKSYKTEQGAIRAIKNKGYEHIETKKENVYTVKEK